MSISALPLLSAGGCRADASLVLASSYDLGCAAIDVAAQTVPVPPDRDYLHLDVARRAVAARANPIHARLAYRRQAGFAGSGGVINATA